MIPPTVDVEICASWRGMKTPPGEKIGVKRMCTHEALESSGLSKRTRGSTRQCAHA